MVPPRTTDRGSTLGSVIVVIGQLLAGRDRGTSAVAIAGRAAVAGAAVQVVGVVPDDAAGDRRLLELAAVEVGHAAVLRGPARDLEAADVDLALRYLPEIRVIVTVGVAAEILATASDYAGWSGAALVAVRSRDAHGAAESDAAPGADLATVLEAPASDPDGTFAGFVGAFAARLDAGSTPADAWSATTRELAVDPA